MDLDRGYGHVAAQNRALDEDGIYTHSMMDSDRVGLPRRWIGFAATELGDCPAKCDHKEGAVGCRKYMFTCVHKGEVELTLWQDNKTIISYGNFHSSARAGELARGAHGDPESFAVWVPEGIFHYNVEGRSPTDGSDQQAKKLDISERRTQRVGIKGISFVLNRALTNAAIMKRFKQPSTIKRWRLDQEHSKARAASLPLPAPAIGLPSHASAPRHATQLGAHSAPARVQVMFLMRYTNAVLRRVKPLRRRRSAGMHAAPACPPAAGAPQPARASTAHVLVDMGAVASHERAAKAALQKVSVGRVPRVNYCKGKCAKVGCTKLPKYTPYHCGACRDSCGAYWHLGCFFEMHPDLGPPRP